MTLFRTWRIRAIEEELVRLKAEQTERLRRGWTDVTAVGQIAVLEYRLAVLKEPRKD